MTEIWKAPLPDYSLYPRYAERMMRRDQQLRSTSIKISFLLLFPAKTDYLGIKYPPPDPVGEHLKYALLSRYPPSRLSTGVDANVINVLGFLLPESIWYLVQKYRI